MLYYNFKSKTLFKLANNFTGENNKNIYKHISLKLSMKSKRGQVTIFIIIAVVLVIVIALFIIFRKSLAPSLPWVKEENPEAYLKSCIEDKIYEGVKELSLVGGTLNNKNSIHFMFTEEGVYRNISYLCYNQNYYYPCVIQEPMLLKHLSDELEDYISTDVRECFNKIAEDLDDTYDVSANYNGFDLDLGSKKIILNIDGKLSLSRIGETKTLEGFSLSIPTPFYDVAKVVQEIISQEAEYCNFEYVGYMVFYPQYKIQKYTTGDGVHIYTVEHKETKEKFRFAIRGCVIPPGL